MLYDLAIIGGGPAGAAAGVYASRKRLKTIFITKDWNSQSVVSERIENWIGTPAISGIDFGKALANHVKTYASGAVDIKEGEGVTNIEHSGEHFVIQTENNSYEARTVLVTAGSSRRKLTVVGADKFENKGIVYCASCDGPLFANLDVAVIGGGNAAFETAAQLLAYCSSVTLLNRSDEFKADPVTVEKVLANPKMKAIKNTVLTEIKGNTFVTGLVYEDKASSEKIELLVRGIFVEIGSVPNTGFAKNVVNIDPYGRIIVDPRTQMTSVPGIWAAGDVTDGLYHQNNIAAGDAVKALEDIYLYLHAR